MYGKKNGTNKNQHIPFPYGKPFLHAQQVQSGSGGGGGKPYLTRYFLMQEQSEKGNEDNI